MRKAKNIFANIDSLSIILYLILVFFGWFNIYASQYNDDIQFTLDFSNRYGKQLYFIGITLLCAFIILIIDWKFYYSLSYILYALIILSLISVLIIGGVTNGATSWFQIGGLKIQPSEFAKFTTGLALAKFFNMQHSKSQKHTSRILSYLIVLVPCLLIILQNDLGTALVFLSFILVLYREGLSINILFAILILGILCLLSLLISQKILIYIFSFLALISLLFFRFNKINMFFKCFLILKIFFSNHFSHSLIR